MNDQQLGAPEGTADADDLMHCAVLFAAEPAFLRAMSLDASDISPDHAISLYAQLAVRKAATALRSTMDNAQLHTATRIASLAMKMHLQDVWSMISNPSLSGEQVDALIASARARTLAAQREARAL